MNPEKFDQIKITSPAQLREWLEKHHGQAESVWLVTYKKAVPDKYVSREAVLDELICFGWTDGIRRKAENNETMQLISQRRAEHWAQSYKDRAARLIREGRMHAAGLQAIQQAKSTGMWNFMDDVDKLLVPDDLAMALNANRAALEFFDAINPSSKRFVLRWLKLAKTASTRQHRIAKLVMLSAQGKKLPGS